VLLLIYGSLSLSGIYYCLRVFWCAAASMSELELEQRTNIKFLVKLGNNIAAALKAIPQNQFQNCHEGYFEGDYGGFQQ
jgi:hypothetical protein